MQSGNPTSQGQHKVPIGLLRDKYAKLSLAVVVFFFFFSLMQKHESNKGVSCPNFRLFVASEVALLGALLYFGGQRLIICGAACQKLEALALHKFTQNRRPLSLSTVFTVPVLCVATRYL